MYKCGNTIKISVTNLPEFRALIEEAENKMEDLRKTLRNLEFFNLEVQFDVTNASASSAINLKEIK